MSDDWHKNSNVKLAGKESNSNEVFLVQLTWRSIEIPTQPGYNYVNTAV